MERSGTRWLVRALTALMIAIATTGAARAQVLVVPERDLEFGLLTPGAPAAVAPTDVARSAQVRIEGRGTYQVSFQLPASLTNANGQQLPLSFSATDGRVSIRHKITVFDPSTTVSFRVNPAEQEAVVNLGGTALPAPGQPAGSYSATIVVMVIQTGT